MAAPDTIAARAVAAPDTIVARALAAWGSLGCGACDMKASAAIVEPRLQRGWAFDSPPFQACIAHLSVLVRSQNLPDRPVWEPMRRIRNARQKLDGFSPVALLVDYFEAGPRGG